MKTVITYGTFDLFHIGHLRLLQRAKSLGDRLIVAVSTDEFNAVKGKKAIIPYDQRSEIVENLKCVDLVIPEESWDQKIVDIRKYAVDVFVMGDDWEGKFDNLREYCDVVYLPRTEGISSSQIRDVLNHISELSTVELKKALDILSNVNFTAIGQALEILNEVKKNLFDN